MTKDPCFEIAFDPIRRRLRWKMRGLWSMEDFGRFAAGMRNEVIRLGPPPLRFDAICDAREFPVQSAVVSAALGKSNDIARSMRSGRTAIVVGSVLNKLQARRTLVDPQLSIFMSMEDAERWLSEGERS